MQLQKGDRVRVNLAPFIGSLMRSDQTVPCEVLDVDDIQVQVRVEPPYRDVSLWILVTWVESRLHESSELLEASGVGQ